MFEAPEIIMKIPDIAELYGINDVQNQNLEETVEEMGKNMFLDQMEEPMVARWEAMLKITPLGNETLNDRRFRVKTKAVGKPPYSLRVIKRKLDTICPEANTMTVSAGEEKVEIKLALKSKKMLEDVRELMEETLPLNMVYNVEIIWNQHLTLSKFTHGELRGSTHKSIREEVFE